MGLTPTVYTSHALLDAEDRLLDRTRDLTGPTVTATTIARVLQRPARGEHELGADQASALTAIATSGRVVDLLVGPAGAGKTTAMRALRHAWETEHGTGSVVGLAPSAGAAEVLSVDLGIATENTAKWWQNHLTGTARFEAGQLVVLDEASLAGTHSLDRITGLAADAGAKVLLVGDGAQLQSVDAGGAFGLLTHAMPDVPELTDVHRFTQPWEKHASLELRDGRTEVIDTYLAHDRITDGDTETMIDDAYAAWRADRAAGWASILISDSNDSVHALNERARTDLILEGVVTGPHEAMLRDETRAAKGDTIITRKNDRRLQAGRGWVRNGDRWSVLDVRTDGSLLVRRDGATRGGKVILPATYVTEHVDLGYAVTSYRAQGVTVDTAHVLADSSMTRENLYVAMTRGRHSNQAYVAIDRPDDAHELAHPADHVGGTGRSVLYGVLQHQGAELSAHETLTVEQERWGTIAQLAAEYETLAAAAQRDRWADLIRRSGLDETMATAAIESDAFGPLAAELRRAEAHHHDLEVLLLRLVTARSFDDADDVAAVLRYRVAGATARFTGSGRTRTAPRLIAGLLPEAVGAMNTDMRQALDERRDLIEARAGAVLDRATAEHAAWTLDLGKPPAHPRQLEAWRRAARVVAAYRDRYRIDTDSVLGAPAESTTQQHDRAAAEAALKSARRASRTAEQTVAPSVRAHRGPRL
nr:AAA family ATPase [Microbacterium aerolatum]